MKDLKVGDSISILGHNGTVSKVIPYYNTEWNGNEYVITNNIECLKVYAVFDNGSAEWRQYENEIYGEFSFIDFSKGERQL